ncbi:hypothetical protein C0993_009064 [Termitomyces sp. T159_Od127]|nr:hypothetical protein C0993_009064 [Termitomyces sp. T159_Od127]
MKRGFLISNNQKPAPAAHPTQAALAHPGTHDNPKNPPRPPTSPEYRYATAGAPPQADDEFKCTILPPPQHPTARGPYALCVFHGRRHESAILSTPGFPAPVPAPTPPLYHLAPPGPGPQPQTRVCAARHIAAGALIAAERPLFLIPAVAPAVRVAPPGSLDASPAQVRQLQLRQYNLILEKCLARLPARDRAAFYALEIGAGAGASGLGPILERMERHALGVRVLGGAGERFESAAVFRDVSRIGHRCAPNATWEFDVASFSMLIRAVCPIEKDEEIFISYVDDESVTGQARRAMLEKYGVDCRCALCTK